MNAAHGFHPDLPHVEYHHRELGVASKTALDELHRSPLHYRTWLSAPGAETPALAFGRALHCALLEPDVFAKSYASEPDFGDCRFKDNKERRNAWRADNAGKTPISSADAATIEAMVESVRSHPLASKILAGGIPEASLRWTDVETGLTCKCRADYYVESRAMVCDVKTTLDARGQAFSRDSVKYRYHVQNAFYRQGFAAVGKELRHFVHIVVEKEPPFAVALYDLDAAAVEKGLSAARADMQTMASCLFKDEWPGYSQSIETLSLPAWA